MRIGVVIIALVLAACGPTPTPGPLVQLGVDNGTTLTVTILVNGQRLLDVPPGTINAAIDTSHAPGLPWRLEARSTSGALLDFLNLQPPQDSAHYDSSEDDDACGVLIMWTGGGNEPHKSSAASGQASPASGLDCIHP